MENPMKIDDLGGTPILETSKCEIHPFQAQNPNWVDGYVHDYLPLVGGFLVIEDGKCQLPGWSLPNSRSWFLIDG